MCSITEIIDGVIPVPEEIPEDLLNQEELDLGLPPPPIGENEEPPKIEETTMENDLGLPLPKEEETVTEPENKSLVYVLEYHLEKFKKEREELNKNIEKEKKETLVVTPDIPVIPVQDQTIAKTKPIFTLPLPKPINPETTKAFDTQKINEIKLKIRPTHILPNYPNYHWPDDKYFLEDFIDQYENRIYKDEQEYINEAIGDLRRCVRYVNSEHPPYYLIKVSDTNKFAKSNTFPIGRIEQIRVEGKTLESVGMFKNIRYHPALRARVVCKTYHKHEEPNPHEINIFPGFRCKRVELTEENMKKIEPWLNHIKNVLAAGDDTRYKYLMTWFAHRFRKDTITKILLNIVGGQGIGKTIYFDFEREFMFGTDLMVTTSNLDHILGEFNGILEKKIMILLNEAKSTNGTMQTKRGQFEKFEKFKSYITDETIAINEKNEKLREIFNTGNYVINSNNTYSVVVEKDDRRYAIMICKKLFTEEQKEEKEKYFGNLRNIETNWTQEVADIMYSYYISDKFAEDFKGVNLEDIPPCEIKKKIAESQQHENQRFATDILEGLIQIEVKDLCIRPKDKNIFIPSQLLYEYYVTWARTQGEHKLPMNTILTIFNDIETENAFHKTQYECTLTGKKSRGFLLNIEHLPNVKICDSERNIRDMSLKDVIEKYSCTPVPGKILLHTPEFVGGNGNPLASSGKQEKEKKEKITPFIPPIPTQTTPIVPTQIIN